MAKDIKFNINMIVNGKNVVVEASTSVKELAQQLSIAESKTRILNKSMINMNQSIQMIQTLSSSINQINGVFNQLTSESREFTSAMKAANTMAGKDSAGFEKLKDQISELAL